MRDNYNLQYFVLGKDIQVKDSLWLKPLMNGTTEGNSLLVPFRFWGGDMFEGLLFLHAEKSRG